MNFPAQRSSIHVRPARVADAPMLAQLFRDLVKHPDTSSAVDDMRTVIERVSGDEQRALLVADHDGEVAGATYLRVSSVTPFNLDMSLQILSMQVMESHRRRGVGRALMTAVTAFAEEREIASLGSASQVSAREANRFLARLGFSAQATWRVAHTAVVRQKIAQLSPGRPAAPGQARPLRPTLGQVVAARRSLRQRHQVS